LTAKKMNKAHHPDDATLTSYAACSVERNFSVVLDMHIKDCSQCQRRIRQAEHLGATLIQAMPGANLDEGFKERLFAMLDQPAADTAAVSPTALETLPDFITDWERTDPDQLAWKRMAPGIRYLPLASTHGQLYMLRIAPGTCLPEHSHQGNELTLVLSGSYSDEIGRFTPGCIADLDDQVNHQPIADRSEDCICLVATDAPLRFHGWVPRLFQSYFKI
jgi:putative transcriptional regulator